MFVVQYDEKKGWGLEPQPSRQFKHFGHLPVREIVPAALESVKQFIMSPNHWHLFYGEALSHVFLGSVDSVHFLFSFPLLYLYCTIDLGICQGVFEISLRFFWR